MTANPRPRLPLATALALALFPAATARAQAPAAAAPAAAVVPFEMLASNHMVVTARINGEGPYRLIFDLGAPVTLISNRAAEASGVVKADAPRSFLFAMRGAAEVRTLRVGDLTAEALPVIVFDHPLIKALGDLLGKPLDGIIGYTFFARYRTTIDYQARRMTFVPVDHEVKDLLKELPARLAGPKEARHRVLAPRALWGLSLGEPAGGPDDPGVPVAAVLAGSPAAEAGIRPGDVLTTLDGRWTASVDDAYGAAEGAAPGPVSVDVLRGGQAITLTVRTVAGF